MTRTSLDFERANVLFNLGVVEAALGTARWGSGSELSDEALRAACGHFQYAAGAFEAAGKAAPSSAGGPGDLSSSTLHLLTALMLGQAQECFAAKLINDGRERALGPTVCIQVAECFDKAYSSFLLLQSQLPKKHAWADWEPHLRSKVRRVGEV